MAATVRIGTCSWADEALSKWFYQRKLPAKERLAWYAEHFDTVEVDSTFYRLPSDSMVQGWAERTPDGFTMHVKAFGLMTRHPVKAEVLPEDLRDEMPRDERGRVDRPPRELRGEVFRRFLAAIDPLRELAGQAEQAYAFFNNNASSEDPENPLGRVAQAATNARQLRGLLDVNRIAASGGAS